MHNTVKHVWFDDGENDMIYALVASVNPDSTLNLITFPTTSSVEHESSIPQGTGGRTWHE